MPFQSLTDPIDIDRCLVVFNFHLRYLVGCFFEEAEEALFLLRIEALQFSDEIGHHLTNLAQILGFHVLQGIF